MIDTHGEQDAYILAVDDGTVFLCSAERIGADDKVHWVFTAKDQRRYIGPPWIGVLNDSELRPFVNAWWHNTKILAEQSDCGTVTCMQPSSPSGARTDLD